MDGDGKRKSSLGEGSILLLPLFAEKKSAGGELELERTRIRTLFHYEGT